MKLEKMIEGELEDTRSLKGKKEYTIKECIVVGAGISGIATARWLKVNRQRIYIYMKHSFNQTLKIRKFYFSFN